MQPKIDTEKLEFVRRKLAECIGVLEDVTIDRPEHGEYVTRGRNHLEEAFTTIGVGVAKTKGYDPWANVIKDKQ